MKIDTDHTMSVLMFIDSYENKMEPKYMITGFCWKDIIFAGGILMLQSEFMTDDIFKSYQVSS